MRPVLHLALLAAALLLALAAAVAMGAVPLSLPTILAALGGNGDAAAVAIVRELRLPRSVLAALVGAALATSGATFQALLRNPLAEPYILGVSGGAALGAVIAIVLGVAATAWALPAAAFAGAIVAIGLVLRIAVSVGRALDTRILLLAGVVAGAFFNACILLALTFADTESFRSAIFWMMGSFSGATWRGSGSLALYLVPGLLILFALARPLDLLAIGEDTAAHLGVRVELTKLLAYGVASLLAAAAVAVSGVIGFIGLIVPHFVRLLWGTGHRFLLPASALLGAAFLVLTDALSRSVAAPTELPVGVLTAFVGVPFFVWVLKSSGKRNTGEGGLSAASPRARSLSATTLRGPISEGAEPQWTKHTAATGAFPAVAPAPPPAPHAIAITTVPTAATARQRDTAEADVHRQEPAYSASDLSFRYPGASRPAVAAVNLQVDKGRCTAILGPNGSGKSTLLRLLLGTLRPDSGEVRYRGRDLRSWPRMDLARRIAVVQQNEEIAFPLSARELVSLGRYPFLGNWKSEGPVDRDAIEEAMLRCNVLEVGNRGVQALSGGERQRVRLARALAQQPRLLVLDEPTVALDVRHEMAIFELLRELTARGTTVLIVTHNLNLAARFADHLVMLSDGGVAAAGSPGDVLTGELIEQVYRWPVRVVPHPGPGVDAGAPQVVALSSPPAQNIPAADKAAVTPKHSFPCPNRS